MLKLPGTAVVGWAVGGSAAAAQVSEGATCDCPEGPTCRWDHPVKSARYIYFDQLPPFYPFSGETSSTIPKLGEDEMRITFMGSSIPGNLRKNSR